MAKTLKSMNEILDENDSLSDEELIRVGVAVAQRSGTDFESLVQWLGDVGQWTGDTDLEGEMVWNPSLAVAEARDIAKKHADDVAKIAAILRAVLLL